MPSPWLTRRLPATAALGLGLALGAACPAVAEPVPMATVIVRGERESVTDPSPARNDALVILVALGGVVIGAGVIGLARPRRYAAARS
jgi:hypothetical protein